MRSWPAAARAFPPAWSSSACCPSPAFRDRLARARVFVSAAEWEDFGIAPLEALDRGAALVCAPAGGPFPALALARSLAPEFVAADRPPAGALARALRGGVRGVRRPARRVYRAAARAELEPYRPEASVTRIAAEVLPALLGE